MTLQNFQAEPRKRMQLLCLIAGGGAIYLFMLVDGLFPGKGHYMAEKYMALPCLLFMGSALSQRLSPSAKKSLLLSLLMVFWFVITQTHHWLTDMNTRHFGIFATVYLLAFPYASVAEDGKQSRGLKWIGVFYVAYSLLLVVFAGMLLLDAVPEILASSVVWQGTRVSLLAHPNGTGCILMLGISFSLYFVTLMEQKWQKYLLSVLTAMQFFVLILTNSRTSIIMTCLLFGGTLFFRFWKGGWKRFLGWAALALAVALGLFALTGTVYDLHEEAQVNKLIRQTEQQTEEASSGSQQLYVNEETGEIGIAAAPGSGQGELSQDIWTMNGRNVIWKAAIQVLVDNPSVRLWGTENISAEISFRSPFPVLNAHNSWIQSALHLGIPGFLLVLVYTLAAAWNLWTLLWRKNVELSKKVMAMALACIMAASLLEAYLFVGEMYTTFTNFFFFLCTGYLIQWNQLAKQGE